MTWIHGFEKFTKRVIAIMNQGLLPIQLEKGSDAITAFSGALIFNEALHAFGLLREFKKFPCPGSNRGLPAQAYLQAIMTTLAGGGCNFEDVQRLLQDQILIRACDLRPFEASSLLKWLNRHAVSEFPLLAKIHDRFAQNCVRRSDLSSFTLDIDAMAIEAEKKQAAMTYLGFKGYMPLLGFIPELGLNVFQCFQTGNTAPASNNLEALQHVYALMPKGKTLDRFRSDSAAYQADIFNFCEEKGIRFSITADFDSAVRSAIAGIPEDAWQPLLDEEGRVTGREYAETVHCMNKTKNAFRLIVQRSKNQQLYLFAEGRQRHYAFATNDNTRPAPELINWHNRRSNTENANKEVKHGLGLDYLPSGDFNVNSFWFLLGLLTYNVIAAMKLFALPEDFKKKKISSLRWLLFHTAGKLIYHGRTLCLKLCSLPQYLFDIFVDCRKKLYQFAAT